MDVNALLQALGYFRSLRRWVTPETADARLSYFYQLAQRAGTEAGKGAEVIGSYVYQTSLNDELLPPRPAVFVARADNDEEAGEVHKRLWNLGDCPFVIIVLPDKVHVYTGFDFSPDNPKRTLLASASHFLPEMLPKELFPFNADAIDTGRIWKEQASHLGSETRVDYRLLTNLKELSRLLQKNYAVSRKTAHALIGKYIYFRYLHDRDIIGPEWLRGQGIQPEEVFGRAATAPGFEALAEALQRQFNGDIFPMPFDDDGQWRSNDAVPFLARTFHGDDPGGQMVLDFGVYNFSYIPVELLSSIYEQFLKDEGDSSTKENGVVYTPEALADYVLAELEALHPLGLDHKVLDPCCGSGVFLVLAYRRLIESLRRKQGERPTAEALKKLLQENIFGVEKDLEACHITAFSLILTLLSHLRPPDLQANVGFQFPTLVNNNIYHADFFDEACPVFTDNLRFDWIVGNPPWTEADTKNPDHELALLWQREAAKRDCFVGERRLDESFTWRAGGLLKEVAYAGLLIKATTLVNSSSSKYRKGFFKSHDVRRITNLSNLRRILFMGAEGKMAEAPAACLIYTNSSPDTYKKPILHFGPFVADQIPVRTKGRRRRVWTIALYESDIQQIDYADAEEDVASLWKTALWGNYQDRRALRRLNKALPKTLGEIANKREWLVCEGPRLKPSPQVQTTNSKRPPSDAVFAPASELEGQRILETRNLNTRFTISDDAIPFIDSGRQSIDKQKGPQGLKLIHAPHIVVTAEIAVYSGLDFVIPTPKTGIAAKREDADYLKAVALYLNSSVARYAHFFINPSWGVYIGKVNPASVKMIPFADLSSVKIKKLASVYDELAERERMHLADYAPLAAPVLNLQGDVDTIVEELLQIPRDIGMVARDFMQVKYQLLEGKTGDSASKPPNNAQLKEYAEQLRLQVDDFAQRHHQITIRSDRTGEGAITATIEVTTEAHILPVQVTSNQGNNADAILRAVQEQHSQWAYVQRSVRIFDGTCVHIVKAARLLDWTQTQAIQDAADLISEVLGRTAPKYERATA